MQFSEVDIKVIRGIRQAVDERGEDWRYPNGRVDGKPPANDWVPDPDWAMPGGRCYNLLPDGSGACIIGCAAVNAGLPTARASDAAYDAQNWGVSPGVKEAMVRAQAIQDEGYTWGFAWEQFLGALMNEGYTAQQIAEALA